MHKDKMTKVGEVPNGDHPKNQPWEPEDPMMLRAEPVQGDPEVMLDCLVEEYARMGWGADRIAELFDDPFFQATHGLKELFGERGIRERIKQTLARCGVFRFKAHDSIKDS